MSGTVTLVERVMLDVDGQAVPAGDPTACVLFGVAGRKVRRAAAEKAGLEIDDDGNVMPLPEPDPGAAVIDPPEVRRQLRQARGREEAERKRPVADPEEKAEGPAEDKAVDPAEDKADEEGGDDE